MTVLDNYIFKTLFIFRIKKNGKIGIIVIGTYNLELYRILSGRSLNEVFSYCSQLRQYIHTFEFYGVIPVNLGVADMLPMKWYEGAPLIKKTVRVFDSIAPMLQFSYTFNIAPIRVGMTSYIYSNPYIKDGSGNVICIWTPSLDKSITTSDFSVESQYIRYCYKNPVFVLTSQSHRHIPAELKEELLINTYTKQVTMNYENIIGDKFIQARLEFKGNLWHYLDYKEMLVYGSKKR